MVTFVRFHAQVWLNIYHTKKIDSMYKGEKPEQNLLAFTFS